MRLRTCNNRRRGRKRTRWPAYLALHTAPGDRSIYAPTPLQLDIGKLSLFSILDAQTGQELYRGHFGDDAVIEAPRSGDCSLRFRPDLGGFELSIVP